REPTLVQDTARFSTDDRATRSIVKFALKRLASADPDAAAAAWSVYKKALTFDAEDGVSIGQDVTIGLARRGIVDPNSELTPTGDGRHVKVAEALILASLNNNDWGCVVSLINQFSAEERATERWQYWLGRANRALSVAHPIGPAAGHGVPA